MNEPKHKWTYQENAYCVEVVFDKFVFDRNNDYDKVLDEIYDHFNGEIKRSSIHMKLQNIKALLSEYNIENSLPLASLKNVSSDNRAAFFDVLNRYNID